jgi:Domain of unknown function (DUF4351)
LEEENNVAYITTAERIGMEKGMQQGRLEGEYIIILNLLQHKFGEVPAKYRKRLMEADADTLLAWSKHILDAKYLQDIFDVH